MLGYSNNASYVGGLVHVNPSTINIQAILRAVEHLELISPVTEQR